MKRHTADAWCRQCSAYKIVVAEGYWVAGEGSDMDFMAENIAPEDESCFFCNGKMSFDPPSVIDVP